MTRDEVLEQLAPERGFALRPIGERPVLLVDVKGESATVALRPDSGKQAIELSGKALAGLYRRINLPPELAKNLSPRTLAAVAGEALATTNSAVMVKDREAIDIVPARSLHILQPERVLRTIERAIPDASFARVLTLPNHVVHLETVGAEEKPVAVGDLVKAGVLTRFSVLGGNDTTVESYVQRLKCTNGAKTNDRMDSFSFGDGDEGSFEHWLRSKARAAYRSLIRQEIPANERADFLAHWLKESKLPAAAREAVQAEALRRPPNNHYDLLNLVTWATSHLDMEPAAISRSMTATAALQATDQHGRTCPVCRRAR